MDLKGITQEGLILLGQVSVPVEITVDVCAIDNDPNGGLLLLHSKYEQPVLLGCSLEFWKVDNVIARHAEVGDTRLLLGAVRGERGTARG